MPHPCLCMTLHCRAIFTEVCALQAARYQIVIMLLVAACSGIGSTAAVLLAVNSIVDQQHRVRRERLVPRAPGSAGVANWIQAQVAKVTATFTTIIPLPVVSAYALTYMYAACPEA